METSLLRNRPKYILTNIIIVERWEFVVTCIIRICAVISSTPLSSLSALLIKIDFTETFLFFLPYSFHQLIGDKSKLEINQNRFFFNLNN